jgi:hypothetical protein
LTGIGHPVSEARLVELKGIEEPVQLHTIEWRSQTGS